MNTYKASIHNYVFNSINAIIIIINGIIMVPIYFHYMSVATYGAWLATGNIVAMLGLIECGFSGVITQKMSVAVASNDEMAFRKFAGANIITAILLAVATFLIGMSLSPFVSSWVNVEESDMASIRLAFVVALISSCVSLFMSLMGAFPQVWQDTKAVGMANMVANLLAIASLLFFLMNGCGVVAIAWSYLVRALFNLLFQGYWIIKHWYLKRFAGPIYDFYTMRELIKDCAFPFLSKLSSVLMGNSQSFIIAHFMNPLHAAIYDITAKVCTVACTFISIINGSFFALFSLTMASNDRFRINEVFNRTSTFFIICLASVCLYSCCFSEPIVYYWVGLDKFGGTALLFVIVLANIVYQIRGYCNNVLFTSGLISESAKLDIACMFVYIIILSLIIKPVQVFSIPVAMAISGSLFIVRYLRIINRDIRIKTNSIIKKTICCFCAIVPFLIVHHYINVDYKNIKLLFLYLLVFSIVYLFALYFINLSMMNPLLAQLFRKRY